MSNSQASTEEPRAQVSCFLGVTVRVFGLRCLDTFWKDRDRDWRQKYRYNEQTHHHHGQAFLETKYFGWSLNEEEYSGEENTEHQD